MKTDTLLNKKAVLYFLFSVLTVWGLKAQCTPTCNMVVGGTGFEALYEDEEDYRMLGSVVQFGPSGGLLETPRNFLTDYASFGTATSGYGIVNNPTTVNPAFYNIDEPMMLISNVGANVSILSYSVSGLRASTTACITVEGYIVSPTTCSVNTAGFRMVIDPQGDGAWTFAQASDANGSTTVGQKFTLTMTRNLGSSTGFTFNLRSGTTGWNNCIVLGISKVEIKGCLDIKVKSYEGDEVCKGELIRFGLDREYGATTYQWAKSTAGSTGPWTNITGNSKTILDEVAADTWYRCTVDGTVSSVLKVNTINCCEIKPGVTSSRKTIYHDNFGIFSGPTSYVDAFGTTRPATGWRTISMPYTVPGPHTAKLTGEVDDGNYVVATLRPGVLDDWMRGQMTEDAAGNPNGGVFLINVARNYTGEIYKHQVNDLCPNVNLYFEVFIANASSMNNTIQPDVEIRLETTGGTVLGSQRTTTGAQGWKRIAITVPPNPATSVVLRIFSMNTSGWATGVDLLMDEVIFRVCSPPIVELYSDLENLAQDATICTRKDINLASQISDLVIKYYDNNPRYLFQASTNGTTWTNISGILTTPSHIHPLSGYTLGSNAYFRIVVATEAELNDFISNPTSQESNCKTISFSDPMKIFLDCPCPTPRRVTIDANKTIVSKTITLCMDESVALSVTPAPDADCDILWFESATEPSASATPVFTGTPFNLTGTVAGTKSYFVRVVEKLEPTRQECWRYDNVSVKVNPAPLTNEMLDACVNIPLAPVASENICFKFKSNYADGTITGTNAQGWFIPYRTLTGATRIGTDTIKVAAGAANSGDRCYPGNLVEVQATPGRDTLYHIYMEDITPRPAPGVVLGGVNLGTTGGNTTTRMYLEVKQEVKLESVTIYAQSWWGDKTLTVTPVLYLAAADGTVGATVTTGWTQQSHTYGGAKTAVVINLNNYTVAPGRYYLGFTFGTAPDQLFYGTRAVNAAPNNYIFTSPFQDNLGGVALNGIGARQGTAVSGQHIISDLKFVTNIPLPNPCGRVKVTAKYFCPPCNRPDIVDNKRAEITVPSSAKKDGDVVVLCAGESVVLTARQLRFDNAVATNQFDILWYQSATQPTAAATPLKPLVNAGTDAWTVSAWTLSNSTVAETRRYYLKVQDHVKQSSQECWVWDYIDVRVNPTPVLSSALTLPATCSAVSYTATSATAGTTFSWSRTAVSGITPNTSSGSTATIDETLSNSTTAPITVTYVFILKVGDCTNTQNVTIVVNPTPTLSSTLTPTAICSGDAFNYLAESATSGISFSWTRAAVSGITQGANSGSSATVNETLTNSTTDPVTVTYVFTLKIGSCENTQNVTVKVNPKPVLNSNPPPVACSGTAFSHTVTSATAGTTFSWTRAAVTDITPATGSGSSATINETLTNGSTAPITVTYVFTLTANGCTNTQNVTVTVNPKPVLSSNLTLPATCSTINHTATSATAGTEFSWTRTAVSGITPNTGSGSSATIDETLTNSTTSPITVTYIFTLKIGDCTNTQNVTVTVNPTPLLSSTLTPAAICSGTAFDYTATSLTAGTEFSWTRAAVSGITPNTGNGSSETVNETLTNTTTEPVTVTYVFTLKIGDCTNTQNVTVTVNPTPTLSSTQTPAAICSGTAFNYTATSETVGTAFSWTRTAIAGITPNTGNGSSETVNETLTNTTIDPITVTYVFTLKIGSCTNTQNVTVTVNPTPTVDKPTDQTKCNGTPTDAVNFTGNMPSGVTYNWTNSNTAIGLAAGGSGDIGSFTATNSTNAPISGTVTVSPTINSCPGTSTSFDFTVNPTPTVNNPGPQTKCNGEATAAVTFTGNMAGITYNWTNSNPAIGLAAVGTGNIASFTATNTTTASISSTITVTPESADGCPGSPVAFTITVVPTPKVMSSADGKRCGAGSVTLGAQASAGEIKWYTTSVGGTPVWTGVSYAPDISATTPYWVEAVDNGCTSPLPRTQVTATINHYPTITVNHVDPVCEGETTQLHINPTPSDATIDWSGHPTATPDNAAGTIVTVRPPYIKSGSAYRSVYTYNVMVTDAGGLCPKPYPVTVTVDEPLTGKIVTTNPQTCEGGSVTIDAGSYAADTYNWTSPGGLKPEARITVSPKETTTYMLIINRGACKAEDDITIEVNSKPVILLIDSVGVRDREIVHKPGTGTQPFLFGVDEVPVDNDPVKRGLSFGLHSFYIIDAAGCRSVAADLLVEPPKLFPPIVFTPNGDGYNDTWEVPGMREIYPDATIAIYDRYGKKLTEYKGSADRGWDGRYLGRDMPTTDYWYEINIKEINVQYVGHFTLLRR